MLANGLLIIDCLLLKIVMLVQLIEESFVNLLHLAVFIVGYMKLVLEHLYGFKQMFVIIAGSIAVK